MADGALLATGCGVFFIFLSGVYVYLRSEVLPRQPRLVELNNAAAGASDSQSAA